MIGGMNAIDPSCSALYKFRQFFEDSRRQKQSEIETYSLCFLADYCKSESNVRWMVLSDPLITADGDYYKFNWPGKDESLDILNHILSYHDLHGDGDCDIQSFFDANADMLRKYDICSIQEFCSFLCFNPLVSRIPSVNRSTVEQLVRSLSYEEPYAFGQPTRDAISYISERKGYETFQRMMSDCDIPSSEWESVFQDLESNPDIYRFEDIYKFTEFHVPYQALFLVGSDSKYVSTIELYNENKKLFDKYGLDSEFKLTRAIEISYPNSTTDTYGILDSSSILDYRTNIVRSFVENIQGCCESDPDLSYVPDGLIEYLEIHSGETLNFSTIKENNGNVDESNLSFVLLKSHSILVFDKTVKITGIKSDDVISILSKSTEKVGINPSIDEELECGWKQLGIINRLELLQLLLKQLPAMVDPVSLTLDLSPLASAGSDGSSSTSSHGDEYLLLEEVRRLGCVSLFQLKENLSEYSGDYIEKMVSQLVKNKTLKYGSMGLVLNDSPPITYSDSLSETNSNGIQSSEYNLSTLERFENVIISIIEQSPGFNPQSSIESKIQAMPDGGLKDLLCKTIISKNNLEEVLSNADDEIIQAFLEFLRGSVHDSDVEIFSQYDVPSNMMIHLFNRSPEYLLALSLAVERGFQSPTLLLEKILRDGLITNRSETSELTVDVRERFYSIVEGLFNHNFPIQHPEKETLATLIMFLLNDFEVNRSELDSIIIKILGNSVGIIDDEAVNRLPGFIVKSDRCLRYTPYSEAIGLNRLLINKLEKHVFSPDKLLRNDRKTGSMASYGIYDSQELVNFIRQFGLVRIDSGYVCSSNDPADVFEAYIIEKENYNAQVVTKHFIRSNGGEYESLYPIIKRICAVLSSVSEQGGNKELHDRFEEELSQYEWVTKTNAQSIIEDKFGLRGAFDSKLMHEFGFKVEKDAFYRESYGSFRECLRENEFSGDDLYITNELRVKMECKAFRDCIAYFIKNLMWIPVSNVRYLNLRSERFSYLYSAIKKYEKFIKEQSKECFLTAYSLSRMDSGITDIDGDDYELIFYESALQASKVNSSSMCGYHFYHDSSSDGYRCIVPDFIRYIVETNGCKISVNEIETILSCDYGIKADLSTIRQAIKKTTCTLVDDVVYTEERMMEGLK